MEWPRSYFPFFVFVLMLCFTLGMAHHASPDREKGGEAWAAPVLLPGDTAGFACGPNFNVERDDVITPDGPGYSLGCDAEVQVSKVKLYAGIDTVDSYDITDMKYRGGILFPVGKNFRVSVGIDGHTSYDIKNSGLSLDKSFNVTTRIGSVF